MTKLLCLMAVIASVAGCASSQPRHETRWYKTGATTADFNMDAGQCRAQAFSVTGGALLQVAIVYNSCMEGKGWELR